MFGQIAEVIRLVLISPAFKTELDAFEQDFRGGLQFTIRDRNGAQVQLAPLLHPLENKPFEDIVLAEPPRDPGGPWPVGYVYHVNTEYPPKEQEYDVRTAIHRFGLSVYVGGKTVDDAEQGGARYIAAAVQCLERNQYMFGALPRAVGASTLAFAEGIAPGGRMHKTLIIQAYHTVFVVKVKELRTS